MSAALERAIAGIPAGRAEGVGVLVAPDIVLTAAHVVGAAIEVDIDFPLVSSRPAATARVLHRTGVDASGSGDFAVLQLRDPPAGGAEPVPVAAPPDPVGHRFRAYGFPAGLDDGVWIDGVLGGRQATGLRQLEGVRGTGHRVAQGFSGGPVWDSDAEAVVGLVVLSDTDDRTKAGSWLPLRLAAGWWPSLLDCARWRRAADVLVVHAAPDRAWASWIAGQFEAVDRTVATAAWEDLDPGRPDVEARLVGACADTTLVVVSEVSLPLQRLPTGGPTRWRAAVRVRACSLPVLPEGMEVIDLAGRDERSAREAVLGVLESPSFPGAGVAFPPAAAGRRAEAAVAAERERLSGEQARRHAHPGRRVSGLRLRAPDEVFYDREEARRELREALTTSRARLILVVGPPGIGKTAIASWVLARLEEDGEAPVDGIAYLSSRTSGLGFERLYADVSGMLGEPARAELLAMSQEPPERRVPELLSRLQDGSWVVLLDNFEDALDPDGEVADPGVRAFFAQALALGAGVRLLVTSRVEPAVPPAALARTCSVRFEHRLPETEAVQMLRALDYDGRAGLRDAPDAEVASAAALGHRIPRALELIASLRRLGPAALAGFYERADVVRELAAAANHELDADRRAVVSVLAVFGRPVAPAALSFVLADARPGLDVELLAADLARGGLVSMDGAQRLLSLHPIDREVALRELPAQRLKLLHRRAADWWRLLRVPPDRRLGLPDIEPHLEEFEHRFAAGDLDAAAEVLSDLDSLNRLLGWDARVVTSLRERIDGQVADPRLVALHEYGMGRGLMILGPAEAAIARFERAIALARHCGDARLEHMALASLGSSHRLAGNAAESVEALAQALDASRRAGEREREQTLLAELSLARVYAGDVERARADARASLDMGGDVLARAFALDALAAAEGAAGDWATAAARAQESLAGYREAANADGIGYSLNLLGIARVRLGDATGARSVLEEARGVGAEIGSRRLEGFATFNLARVLDGAQARTAASRARELLVADGAPPLRAAEALCRALAEGLGQEERRRALADVAAAVGNNPDLLA